MPVVAPISVKTRLTWVRPDVRLAASQCGTVRSPSRLPPPYLTTSSPRPVTTPTMSTQAATRPAATRPLLAPPAGSGRAGRRSGRSSGARPSLAGAVTGWPAAFRAQLERRRGDSQPGNADRPAAENVRHEVHAQQNPADPDQGDKQNDYYFERFARVSSRSRKEHQQHGSVADVEFSACPLGKLWPRPCAIGWATTGRSRPTRSFSTGSTRMSPRLRRPGTAAAASADGSPGRCPPPPRRRPAPGCCRGWSPP